MTKDIKGYEGHYAINDDGEVWSYKHNRFLNPFETSEGRYMRIDLCLNGKVKRMSVHRLVAEAFVDNPNAYDMVNHKDENKQNNHYSNLEWCTAKYNVTYGNAPLKRAITRGKRIRCINTGEEFYSIGFAARKLGLRRPDISSVCSERRKSTGGMKFEYVYLQKGQKNVQENLGTPKNHR